MLILMGLLNGARHLEAQLTSLLASGLPTWELRVSDDGSTDASRAVLARFAAGLEGSGFRLRVGDGPGRGFAANYLTLLADLPEVPGCVALADQDDIWLPGRLARARDLLGRVPGSLPAFTFARRIDWFPQAGRFRPSAPLRRRPSFANALVENVAYGNTLVLNPAAARIARRAAPLAEGIYAHDWFLYQLLTGAGALCLADRAPALLYRQHGGNAIGAARGLRAWAGRKGQVLRGVYAERMTAQIAALSRCEDLLLDENRAVLGQLRRARGADLPERLRQLHRAGLYRQSWQGNLGFWGAAVLGRV
ncbi:glycosyltransferase [Pseudooceanicola sp. 200-1SW]|uniref:glycosyltransferase n=1 Tax=Pseudooceanicola sp. 200-1SW TaxID=3425949 RepID=UPI003D7F86F7